jgi:hypothetical protein
MLMVFERKGAILSLLISLHRLTPASYEEGTNFLNILEPVN